MSVIPVVLLLLAVTAGFTLILHSRKSGWLAVGFILTVSAVVALLGYILNLIHDAL